MRGGETQRGGREGREEKDDEGRRDTEGKGERGEKGRTEEKFMRLSISLLSLILSHSEAISRIHEMTTMAPSNTSNLCVKYLNRNAISFNRTCEVRTRSHDKGLLAVKGLKLSHAL